MSDRKMYEYAAHIQPEPFEPNPTMAGKKASYSHFAAWVKTQDPFRPIDHDRLWTDCVIGDFTVEYLDRPRSEAESVVYQIFPLDDGLEHPVYSFLNEFFPPVYGDVIEEIAMHDRWKHEE